MEISGVLHGVK